MIIGHNPGLEDIVEGLTGRPTALPTAAAARIELNIDMWADLSLSECGRLTDVWRPREIPAPESGTRQ